ncbi:MAG: carboxypeptidase regulatory-like domain-containing protein [Nitrospirae bacterium]|nr:carboxypeptidase regulatory-like domain-containing protein [Nitrospirota bacterium]
MLTKLLIGLLIVISFSIILSIPSHAWLTYHKPEFKGQVINAETKQPIDGAVVVAVYNKATMGVGAGSMSSVINIRETLTDKDGMFRIPSYTTLIQPFSWEISASFIIFKPGYGTFPKQHKYPPGLSLPDQEIFFSAGVGAERSLKAYVGWRYEDKILKTGIVELPKLKTWIERIESHESAYIDGDIPDSKIPKFRLILKEEDNYLKPMYRFDRKKLNIPVGEFPK